jgi:hypothetical protein
MQSTARQDVQKVLKGDNSGEWGDLPRALGADDSVPLVVLVFEENGPTMRTKDAVIRDGNERLGSSFLILSISLRTHHIEHVRIHHHTWKMPNKRDVRDTGTTVDRTGQRVAMGRAQDEQATRERVLHVATETVDAH